MSADESRVGALKATNSAAPANAAVHEGALQGDAEPVKSDLRAEAFDIVKTLAYALGIALVLKTLLFQPFTIPSASMEPNLYEGDYIVVSKWDYGFSRYSFPLALPFGSGRFPAGKVKRGDIVVFKKPVNPKLDYIKRVVGLPGDRIQMRDAHLYVNDQPVKDTDLGMIAAPDSPDGTALKVQETFPDNGKTFVRQSFPTLQESDERDQEFHNTQVFVVPAGQYFMMGDNRDDSADSRVPPELDGVGYVPAENIVGKAQFILLSWKTGSALFKPWTWFNLRFDRFFKPLS